MDQSFTTPAHRQLNSHLTMMIFIFFLLLSLIFAVTYFKVQQNVEQLSHLKQKISYQQALVKASKLLEKTLSDQQTSSFQQNNQKLITQWSRLNKILANNSAQFTLWFLINQKSHGLITRIVSRSEHNRGLLKQTVEQLKKISEILTHNISQKNRQLKELYQLVIKDNVNDSVTVNRAKAHINANTALENLKVLKQEFDRTIEGFEQLTIKTSSMKFEKLSQQALTTLALHDVLASKSNTASLMLNTNEPVEALKLLLLIEQRTVAKWRGYLRLTNEYRTSLQKQFDALQIIITDTPLNKNQYALIKKINEESLLVQITQTLTVKQQTILLWLTFVVLCLAFIYLVMSISHKYKVVQHQGVEVFTPEIKKDLPVEMGNAESIIEEVYADKGKTCFDVALYIKHQGTVELAMYMLDEYLESNDESFTELCHAIKVKNKPSAEQAIMVLMQNARILAADKLIALTLQLENSIAKQAFDKVAEVLLVTQYELTVIKKYSNSI
jgi:hypothetical protein